jgi:hypothetical protein
MDRRELDDLGYRIDQSMAELNALVVGWATGAVAAGLGRSPEQVGSIVRKALWANAALVAELVSAPNVPLAKRAPLSPVSQRVRTIAWLDSLGPISGVADLLAKYRRDVHPSAQRSDLVTLLRTIGADAIAGSDRLVWPSDYHPAPAFLA